MKGNDIKFFSATINAINNDYEGDDIYDSGVDEQRDYYEKLVVEEQVKQELEKRENESKINELLKGAPIISVVSDEDLQNMVIERKNNRYFDYAIKVARITEKTLLDSDNINEDEIASTFDDVTKTMSQLTEDKYDHSTFESVKILHKTWIYGDVIRRWWNKKYIHGEEAEVYEDVCDYRLNDKGLLYRIRPKFPGAKNNKKNQ